MAALAGFVSMLGRVRGSALVLSATLVALVAAASVVAAQPVAENGSFTTKVNTLLSVFPDFSDPDGDPVVITAVTDPEHGSVVCDDISCDYTPDDGYLGPDSFDYTVSDGAESATATISIEVVPNGPPHAPDIAITTRVDSAVSFFPAVTDPDGDDLELTGNTDPANGTALCSGVTCRYTPDPGFAGTDTFDYVVSDGLDTAAGTVTVTVTGAPVDDVVVTASGAAITFDVLANDVLDSAAEVIAHDAPVHGSASCDRGGACTYTPASGFSGGDHFRYAVTGGGSATVWLRVTAPATSAPGGPLVLAGIDAEDGGVGGHGPIAAYVDLANSILARVENGGTGILVAGGAGPGCSGRQVEDWWKAVAAGTGQLVTFADAGAIATANLSSYALVGVASSVAETFCGLTNEENAAFALRRADVKAFVNGGGGLLGLSQTGLSEPYGYLAELGAFRSVLGLEYSDIDPTDAGRLVGITDALDVHHWHDVYVEFPDWVEVLARNAETGDPAAVGGTSVVVGNQPPTAADASVTTQQDVPVDFALSGTDPEGGALTFAVDSGPAHGSVVCEPSGACTYTPDAGFSGDDSFTFRASDGVFDSNTATISITVDAVSANEPPYAVDDELATDEDTAGSVDVLANDSDPDGDPLTVTSHTAAEHGSVDCAATGTCTYEPVAGFNGTDSFAYEVSDGRGGTDTAIVSVTAEPVNDAPLVVDDELTTAQDTSGSVAVLANDSDPDGDPLTVTASTDGEHGTVACTSGGSCTYTPAALFSGADSFTYTVSDGNGGVATGTVSVRVEPVIAGNRLPVAVDDELTTPEGVAGSLEVLGNDSDPDGDTLTVTSHTGGANGTVDCAASGACTYTPASGFTGSDSFAYTVSDGEGGTAVATVAVAVTAVSHDTKAPACWFNGMGMTADGRQWVEFAARDSGSGLASIHVIEVRNTDVALPEFEPGTTAKQVLRATTIRSSKSSNLLVRVTDVAGNETTCDPVFATVRVGTKAKPGVQTFRNLPAAECKFAITNGRPGLQRLRIAINGRVWKDLKLKPGKSVRLDAALVMKKSRNTVTVTAYGRKGSTALLAIADV